MKYITGIHALNIQCSLDTCGDWHESSLYWDAEHLRYNDTENSRFGDWGIENGKKGYFANTLRAILDLMEDCEFRYLKGFKDDFICTDKYDYMFFEKVKMFKTSDKWDEVYNLMLREYGKKWKNYLKTTVKN